MVEIKIKKKELLKILNIKFPASIQIQRKFLIIKSYPYRKK